jgi:hypothetical protein
MKLNNPEQSPAGNSTYPKVAVQCLNQAFCLYQSFCLADSEVLRNRHLRVAAKRYFELKIFNKHFDKRFKTLNFL